MINPNYYFLSLNNVRPFTSHEIPKANNATDSNINTGYIFAITVSLKKNVYIIAQAIAKIMTIPQK